MYYMASRRDAAAGIIRARSGPRISMRIHVTFIDRVGITQEVLALLGGRNLNLDAVEMVPPNVYIDAPTLSAQVLDELRRR